MTILYDADIKTYVSGQTSTADSWLISTWAAGQTGNMNWTANNVTRAADGSVNLILDAAAAGSSRPYEGGELQSKEVATTGTWTWVAQAPKMVSGAVFGMFTYKADYQTQPWIEFDFEFVGADTTKVQLNIHMEDPAGRHISLDQAMGGPIIVDLGFDAALAKHAYEVTVTETGATFYVDGKVVGQYGPSDMPGGIWQIGPQKSFVDIWSVSSGQAGWAGSFNYDGTPLVANFDGFDIRPNEYTSHFADGGTITPPPPPPVIDTTILNGDAAANALLGTLAGETINGLGGNDTLGGAGGNDKLFGGEGNDRLISGLGNDLLDGGNGTDWAAFDGTPGATVDLRLSTAQNTGYGTDTFVNVENLSGGAGANTFTGNDFANHFLGQGGDDRLVGNGGADTLDGGTGNDHLDGGAGGDVLSGGDGNDTLVISTGNDAITGGTGSDTLLVTGATGATIDLRITTGQYTGYGTDTISGVENVTGGAANDRLTGDNAANILLGNGGADTLTGGIGADVLQGGAGRDSLFGGVDSDRDTFVFASAGDSTVGKNRDIVSNFKSGTDVIDLHLIDANSGVASDQAFTYTGNSASARGVWYSVIKGDAIISIDTTGDARADMQIHVESVTSLSAGDFIL